MSDRTSDRIDPHRIAHDAGRRGELPVEETERLIAADKVEGTGVFDPEGRSLGTVSTIMVDKFTGKVAYAVLSFGGFLGLGERYHPLPWHTLSYDTRLGGFVVAMSKEQLERAPSYAAAESPWADPGFGRSVYDYYNVPWYF